MKLGCQKKTILAAAVITGVAAFAAGGDQTPKPPELPFVKIDAKKRHVDLDAAVIRQQTAEGEWLELLACTAGGRDHESLLVVKARPSHVHLALLMIGLEPGKPMRWQFKDGKIETVNPPRGPRIAVTAHYQLDGEPVEVPVNQWLIDHQTKKPPPDNVWLFAGSRFVEQEDKSVYLADLNGSVLSLVNFGDELLARPTDLTNLNDNEAWGANAKTMPPKGTKVTLRLKPLPKKKKKGYEGVEAEPAEPADSES